MRSKVYKIVAMDERQLPEPAEAGDDFPNLRLNLIGDSPRFKQALDTIPRMARCGETVLIQGETGTGKEVAARAIHYLSSRRNFPFVALNCGAISDDLVESALFGHVRGAFTDAKASHHGVVVQAQNGTLFLDEIETMSHRAQVALLRFLQDKHYQPVGDTVIRRADVRVIGATNRDLRTMVAAGTFRCDLLYRLDVLPLELPPLRDREDDVVVIAESFLRRASREHGTRERRLTSNAIAAARAYPWPGNIRELENMLLRELLLSDAETITLESICNTAQREDLQPAICTSKCFREAKLQAIAAFEKAYLIELLGRTSGNISLASRLAGKERSRLTKLMKKYGLARSQFVDLSASV